MEGTDGTEGESCSVTSEPAPEDMTTNSPCPSCEDPVLSDGQSSVDELWCNSQSSAIENRCKEFTSNGAEEQPQLLCQLCEEDPPRTAVKTCTVCAVRYCDPCLALTHPPRPPFSEHKLINPRPSFKKTVMCPDHPSKPVEMYCVQDQTPVCLLCEKVGRHKQHNMAALEEVFSQRRAELQAWVDRMGAWLTHGEDKVRRLQEKQESVKTSAAELKSRIEKECDDLVDRISKRNTEMDRQVAEASNADTANLARLIRDVQDNIPKAHASLSKAEDLLHETDHANFLQSSVSVMAEIHRMVPILGMNIENVSCAIDKLTVDFSQQKQVVENINIYKRYIPTMFPSPHGFPRAMSPYIQQHAPLATAGFPVVHGPPFHTYPTASAPGFNTVPAMQCTCPPQGHQGTFKIRQPPSQGQGQPVSSLAHGGYLQNVPVATCPPFVGAAPSAQQPVSTCPPLVSGAPPSGQQQVATCPPFIGAPPSAQQPPVQPTILHDLCSASMEEVNIVWQAVYNADEYQVRYTLEDRQVAAVVHACSFTATHLKPATVYSFEIRARNVAGSSQPSVTCLATEGKGFKFRFDPKTPGRFLALSGQNTRVTLAAPGDKPSGSPARFTDGNTVLGDKQVTSGRQYWEVSTGGAGSHYAIGVAYASMPRDRDIRDTTKSWAFVQHEKTQTFHHNEVTVFRTEADTVPSKIGVLLDYDAGQISVHDADRGTVIYTHKTTFTDPVYPAFSLWQGSLQLYTGLEKQQSFTQFAEKEEEPLTATILATLPPQEQKQMLGERIFPIVQVSHPKLAGKITGMLLEIDNDELLKMLDNREDLNAKVDEAVAVLSVHKASLKEKRIGGEPSENGK